MKEKYNIKTLLFDVFLSVILGLIFAMIGIVLFSVLLNYFDINSSLIIPINQCIKMLAVFLGCLIGIKEKKLGFVKGALSGALIILILFLIFSGMGGSVVFTKEIFYDIICGAIVGMIGGALAVNIKKDKKTYEKT